MKTKILLITAVVLLLSMLMGCSSSGKEELTSLDQLNGCLVGVQTGTQYEDAFLQRCPDAKIQLFSVANDMLIALKQGKLDAVLAETVVIPQIKSEHPWIYEVPEPIDSYDIVFGFGKTKNAKILKDQFNDFIASIKQNGVYDEMESYWMHNFSPDTCVTDKSGITGENGKLTIALEGGYEPYAYHGFGELQGYDVDFIYRFCREYGYTPVFYEINYDAISAGLESGKFDIGTNLLYTQEREGSIEMSDPYNALEIKAVVAGGPMESTGFFQSLKNSFHKTFVKDSRWMLFADGAKVTLFMTVVSMLMGTCLGFLLYLLCRDSSGAMRLTELVSFIIGTTPTILFLMILYYVVFGSWNISGIWVSVVAFSLLFGTSVYDMITDGIAAVGIQQYEGARALGYGKNQTLFHVLLPQAARHIFPRYKNEIIALIKETSIVGYIAVSDLTKMSDIVRNRTYEAFFPLISTAVIYFAITGLLIALIKRIEIKFDPKRRTPEQIASGIQVKEF